MNCWRRFAAGMMLLALALVNVTARAQAASDLRAQPPWPPASSPRWICWADPKGHWTDADCKRTGECKAHCRRIGYCMARPVANVINLCSRTDSVCTPLMLHRRLSRLGCTFDPDTFWVGNEAKPNHIEPEEADRELKAHPGKAPVSWASPTCYLNQQKEIEDEVNALPDRNTSNGRHAAYAALLRRGCHVDLRLLKRDGDYSKVQFNWPDKGPVDEFGVAAQGLLTIDFVPKDDSDKPPDDGGGHPTPPVEPLTGEWSACAALEQLHDAKLLALCKNKDAGGEVRIRFPDPKVEPDPPTQRVLLLAPPGSGVIGQPPPLVTTPPPVATSPPPIPEPPAPTLSVSGAVGSAGVGAVLGALAKWLVGRFARRPKEDEDAEIAKHETQDVHVSVGFLERPRVRRRERRAS